MQKMCYAPNFFWSTAATDTSMPSKGIPTRGSILKLKVDQLVWNQRFWLIKYSEIEGFDWSNILKLKVLIGQLLWNSMFCLVNYSENESLGSKTIIAIAIDPTNKGWGTPTKDALFFTYKIIAIQ